MKIYYDLIFKEWYQSENSEGMEWGFNNQTIEYKISNNPSIPFKVKKIRGFIGPIVGILTSDKKDTPFVGNVATFKRISNKVQHHGGIVVIFTAKGFMKNHIKGFVYVLSEDKWLETTLPYPNICYNRIPFRRDEQQKDIQQVIQQIHEKGIPFFNPHFFDKWATHQALIKNKMLRKHLPYTAFLTDKTKLKNVLAKYSALYVKPILGYKGNGIVLLSYTDNGISCKSHHETKLYGSINDFWKENKKLFKSKNYIMQEKIELARTDENNTFDLRILCHYVHHNWCLSGIGVRAAKKDGLTTHVPQGGKIVPLDHIYEKINIDFIKELIKVIGQQLQSEYGDVREFSIDLGVTTENNYYIFEVNAKPMVFDEKSIRKKGLDRLLEIFYEESGFKES